MKKITIFALHLQVGGIEKAIANMANMYVENGYDVQIYCMYDMGIAYRLDDRIQVTYLMKSVPNKKEFKEALHRKNPISIIKEGLKAVNILMNKKRVIKNKIREISDGVIMTTRHEDNLILAKYGAKDVQKIGQLHHDTRLYPSYMNEYANGYLGLNQLIVLTEETKLEIETILQKTDVDVLCIPNMIDYPVDEPKYEAKQHVCLAVGRLHPVKGFDRLIRMFSKVKKDWKLQIIGGGEEYQNLKNLIEELGMSSNIELLGEKTTEELKRYYRQSSIYCMSSHSEGQGLVLLEAMSYGNALLAFDVRVGPSSVMKDQEVGYLIDDGDEDVYIKKLEELMDMDTQRLNMQKNARRVSQSYDKTNVAKLWLDLIEVSE